MSDNNQITTLDYPLPVLERLIEQGQPQFGVFAAVNQINYLDYHSHLISQKPVALWRKQFKANQFAFIQLVHGDYRVCLAIATIKLATTAFAYVYNEQTGALEIVEALQPLLLKAEFKGDHQQGQMSFEHQKLSVHLNFSPQWVTVQLTSDLFNLAADLQRGDCPLAVCSPSGRRGWSFTQKEPFINTEGELIIHQKSKHYSNLIEDVTNEDKTTENTVSQVDSSQASNQKVNSKSIRFNDQTLANLDWTLGFMRHETNWFWCCINTQLKDHRHFMLNLSMGVNETGVSENACWIDGQVYHLPPVMFRRNQSQSEESGDQLWIISNQNLGWSLVDINLSFTPIKVYKKTDDYAVVASIFEQWLGLYSGHITIGDQKIVIDKVLGLAEDHFAKW